MHLVSNLQTQINQFHQYCLEHLVPLMQPDISKYAPNRYRLWLLNEPYLGNQPKLSPAYSDPYLNRIIQWLYPGCDTALISYHGQASNFESDAQIKHHRDTSFASPTARMLNLGNVAHFSYSHYRRNNDPTACTNYLLNPGDLVQFDCKHLHACTHAASGRISLVMWQLNKLKLFIG
jgi:hypothetical protein